MKFVCAMCRTMNNKKRQEIISNEFSLNNLECLILFLLFISRNWFFFSSRKQLHCTLAKSRNDHFQSVVAAVARLLGIFRFTDKNCTINT